MNFSVGKALSGVLNAIGSVMSNNFPVVDVYQREHSTPYSKNIVVPITVATQRSYQIPDYDFFKDKIIIGISTRQQNAGDTRYSKNGNKLINAAGMAAAFLTLSQNSLSVIESMPLESLVHETSNVAGTYLQVLIEGEFTPQQSTVQFAIDPGVGNVGRDVELIVYYVPKQAACYQ
ncbi:MAG: hypothetical protein K1X68_13660 [Saprospiraceae bacterium]|nr:hypothetical protein [Saprospiraceae bacterium]HMW39298.1 hypothetical protein [Saprospiraceae bacterium]HMX89068.1 hypothetical protein [Saprospiraceae bacterium]HMZ40939.1 hypothetical protein [Saprospiraceae bacterium]HNC37641.1 hypothetical protein [Saprospiraceae bacterium]